MIEVVVHAVRALARDVLWVSLRERHGHALPGAAPGAHIDLVLPNGLSRSYSLTHTPGTPTQAVYEVAVGLDAASRGGSRWIHEQLRVGQTLQVSAPRNHFELDPAHRRLLLIAGGIGITPLYAMAQQAQRQGLDWQLLACVRSASRLAFQEELSALDPQRVHTHVDQHAGQPVDLSAWLARADWDGVYACGPAGMLDALSALTPHWPVGRLRMERFRAAAQDDSAASAFELVLARSGLQTTVQPHESALDALERLGLAHPFACREGLCGTCEVALVEGTPEHRDSVLDPQQRALGRCFIPCVSRCGGDRLVMDL